MTSLNSGKRIKVHTWVFYQGQIRVIRINYSYLLFLSISFVILFIDIIVIRFVIQNS